MAGPANFIWGAGGAQLTPEEIALQRAVLAKKRLAGVDTSPIGSWAQGAARVADALGDVLQEKRLNEVAATNKAEQDSQFNTFASYLTGGQPVAPVGQAQPIAATTTTSPAPALADGEIANYIRQSATARGIDPDIAIRVAMSEGGVKDPVRQSDFVKNGVREPSYGPFQLYMGGGLGNKALEAGIDPRDPNQWRQGVDFALDQAATGGWSPWYGAAKVGVGNRAGLDNARAIGFGQPPAASPLAASPTPQDAAPPLPSPVTVANAPTVAAAPAAQAQAPSIGRTPASPALIQALKAVNSPYSSEATKGIAKILIDQYGAQQKLSLADQQRQLEIGRRTAIAQQLGVNPAYAQDDDIWKEGVKNKLAPPSTVTIDNKVYDTRNPGQPLIVGAPQLPTSAQEYEFGQKNPGFVDNQIRLRTASAPKTEGAIPPGYQVNRDANGNAISVTPLPGSPAALEAEELAKKKGLQEGQKDTATDIVTNAGVQALQAMKSAGLPSTGLIGKGLSMLPSTNAAEVRRNVDVLKSNATVENLNAMRAASPTGGALGSVTEKEGAMLAAKSGILDPDSPNFERDLKDYVKTMLEVVQGRDKGRKSFESLKWDARPSGNQTSSGVKWSID